MAAGSDMVKRLARKFGVEIRRYHPVGSSKDSRVVSLQPADQAEGRVLLSYVIEPFLRRTGEAISNDHTHDWESYQIASAFLERGFAVDVISYLNRTFEPEQDYAFFVAARTNFERIARKLNPGCRKVAHLDTAHWLFNNSAAYQRLFQLQQRRGVTLNNIKMVEPNWAIEHADVATVLGNQFTIDTYAYANKPIHRIPISAPCTYPWNDDKDFDRSRNNYLWFGSSGFVHKGLDVVLEAFAAMPDHHLTVCGPLDDEPEFVSAFSRELFETPNIHTLGWVDVGGLQFMEVVGRCIGLVYPSCSEGGGGSAITCMHAGLIPILSREASVDIDDAGILLTDSSPLAIREQVRFLSGRHASELQQRARASWEIARCHHTRERFAAAFEGFVDEVLLDT